MVKWYCKLRTVATSSGMKTVGGWWITILLYCTFELSWVKRSSVVNILKERTPVRERPTTPFRALKPFKIRAGYEAFVFNIYG